MNRIINNPDLVVEDMLQGILLAHPELVALEGNPRVIKRACAPVAGKVGIVTGGGSGHEPAFLGYVGNNLVDAVAVGEHGEGKRRRHHRIDEHPRRRPYGEP